MADTVSEALSDDAVVTFVAGYIERNGIGLIDGVGVHTSFADLGLDSITTTGLLIAAREELIVASGVPASAPLTEIPALERVGDLAAALRGLCGAGA